MSVFSTLSRLLSGGFGFRRSGFGKLSRLDARVRLDLAQLDRGLAIRPGHDPAERHFNTPDIAVIRIIHAGWDHADDRIDIADLAYEQAALTVEVQLRSGVAFGAVLDNLDRTLVNAHRRKA